MIKSATFNQELENLGIATETQNAEADFIEKLKVGDTEAFDKLITTYTDDIYKLLIRITGNCEEACDLTQETFLRALKGIKNFRGKSSLKTWLFRIAINASNSRFRWWQKRGAFVLSFESKEVDLRKLTSKELENPEETTLQKERDKLLIEALMKLPKDFRNAVILRDIEGFSYEEIAEILQVNLGTVKSRIARGREELRKYLSDLNF